MITLLFCLVGVCLSLVHDRSLFISPRLHSHPIPTLKFSATQLESCSAESEYATEWKLENNYPQVINNHIKRMESSKIGVFSSVRRSFGLLEAPSPLPIDLHMHRKLVKTFGRYLTTIDANNSVPKGNKHNLAIFGPLRDSGSGHRSRAALQETKNKQVCLINDHYTSFAVLFIVHSFLMFTCFVLRFCAFICSCSVFLRSMSLQPSSQP